jgi:hypothetical protein
MRFGTVLVFVLLYMLCDMPRVKRAVDLMTGATVCDISCSVTNPFMDPPVFRKEQLTGARVEVQMRNEVLHVETRG